MKYEDMLDYVMSDEPKEEGENVSFVKINSYIERAQAPERLDAHSINFFANDSKIVAVDASGNEYAFGGGDMYKAVYDKDNDGVVDYAKCADMWRWSTWLDAIDANVDRPVMGGSPTVTIDLSNYVTTAALANAMIDVQQTVLAADYANKDYARNAANAAAQDVRDEVKDAGYSDKAYVDEQIEAHKPDLSPYAIATDVDAKIEANKGVKSVKAGAGVEVFEDADKNVTINSMWDTFEP